MKNNDVREVLTKALQISKSSFYTVKVYESNGILYTEKKLSYLELGMYLTSNVDSIKEIKIFTK